MYIKPTKTKSDGDGSWWRDVFQSLCKKIVGSVCVCVCICRWIMFAIWAKNKKQINHPWTEQKSYTQTNKNNKPTGNVHPTRKWLYLNVISKKDELMYVEQKRGIDHATKNAMHARVGGRNGGL